MDKTAELTIARSCDLDFEVVLRVSSYSGPRDRKPLTSILGTPEMHAGWTQPTPSDLFVRFQLWSDNKPLSVPFQTAHKSFKPKVGATGQEATLTFAWNQAITLPIKYRDLPLNAQLAFTVFDTRGPPAATSAVPVGGATLKLFGKKATIKRGKQRLRLWPGQEADGSMHTSTPSKVVLEPGQHDEMGRLEKLVKKHQSGDVPRVDWLDKLAFRRIEQIHAAEAATSREHFLYVDLPNFDFPVVFGENEYAPPSLPALTASTSNAGTPQAPAFPIASTSTPSASQAALFSIIDPEIVRENIVEAKHRRLIRGHRSGPLDRELKPNAKIRDELNEILQYPPLQSLTAAQRDLIWRFRFYLSRDKRALTKFLKSVVWSDPGEVRQAVEELLPSWTDIEMQDALELLGPGEAFRDKRVKAYAVKQISRADDDELMLYLLQLVQALKFDSPTSSSSRRRKAVDNSGSASRSGNQQSLEDFLVHRSVRNHILGNHFYWYLMCEVEDEVSGKLFKKVAYHFMTSIEQTPEGPARRDEIRRQAEFVTSLSKLARDLRSSKDARPKKIDKMRAALHDSKHGLSQFAAIPLPLDARIRVTGVDADKSTIFKSNLFPLRLSLKTQPSEEASDASAAEDSNFSIIFKNGDDLRQDQLVIQLFTLMDRLLRNENLDLRMMPYRVLATTPIDGMVQFVPSSTIGAIVSEYGGSLLAYLRHHHADEGSVGTYGVQPDVLDTYIRSCAGHCVFTYLLGVGDRHLDNLLLTPDGHFFHVDFGYILGRDPKPYPPAVKLSKEMVDAMGGMQSPHYNRFKKFCFTAFTILRKSANLLVNLIALMVDASIPDIKFEPDKAVMKVQDKFRLDLSEEEAIKHLEGILNETSTWAAVLDRLHNAAQALRA